MFCPKCGAKALDGATFCQECGGKLTADTAARPAAAPEPARRTPPADNVPQAAPKKKKSRKLPLVLAAVGLVLVFVLIAANSDDLAKRGEQARKDEEYIASQQALAAERDSAAASMSTASTASTGALSSADEAKRLVEQWFGEHDIVYGYTVEYDESIPTDAYESYMFNFYIKEAFYGTIYAAVDTGALSVYVDGSDGPVSLDDWYRDTWQPYLNGDDDSYAQAYAPAVQMDPDLCGRWRSTDGTSIVLDEYGGAQTSMDLRPWWALGRAESLSWEASNGQLKLITGYAAEYKYTYYPIDSENEYNADHLRIDSLLLHRVNGSTGDSMIGEWDDNDMGGPYFTFREDGTGAFANDKRTTWTADDENVYIFYSLYSAYDYYVVGDTLELFFSDSSKTFIRVGN